MKSMKLAFLIGRIFFTITRSLTRRNSMLKARIVELEDMLWPDRRKFKNVQKYLRRKKWNK